MRKLGQKEKVAKITEIVRLGVKVQLLTAPEIKQLRLRKQGLNHHSAGQL